MFKKGVVLFLALMLIMQTVMPSAVLAGRYRASEEYLVVTEGGEQADDITYESEIESELYVDDAIDQSEAELMPLVEEIINFDSGFVTEPMIAAGIDHTVALRSDGTVWAWGNNWNGTLGDGTRTSRSTPVQVQNLSNITSVTVGIDHTVALRSDGTVWAWGANWWFGQLGDGTNTSRSTPVQVQNLANITTIAAGRNHTVALRSDGTVWTWGWNGSGQLGDGTNTNRNTPVHVQNLTNITAITGGASHTVALRNDGTVWTWGWNDYGQLGDETNTNRNTPVHVQNLTNITAIAGGASHTVALRSDGTVWTWGRNGSGQLGDGTNTNRNTPVQVQNLTNITAISGWGEHTVALRSDGTVWTWGRNGSGQLGDGTNTSRNTPIQIQNLTNMLAIVAGVNHTAALRSDGMVWMWGSNGRGQLGDGTNTNRNTPVQVLGENGIGYFNLGSSTPPITPPPPTNSNRIRDLFENEVVAYAVAYALGFESSGGLFNPESAIDNLVTQEDLNTITELEIITTSTTPGISLSLVGIERLVNLEILRTSKAFRTQYRINDLSPLSGLTNLTTLYLNEHQISDLRPLTTLSSLRYLNLNNNNISDLSPLSSMTSLEILYLNENRITDLRPLASLTLRYLNVARQTISLGSITVGEVIPFVVYNVDGMRVPITVTNGTVGDGTISFNSTNGTGAWNLSLEGVDNAFSGTIRAFAFPAHLFEDNSSYYDHELATFAAELSALVYNEQSIRRHLVDLGMENIVTRNYGATSPNTAVYSFSTIEITREENNYNLIIIAIRGTQVTSLFDWLSNAAIGTGMHHHGFKSAQERLIQDLQIYLNEHISNSNSNIILVTGHSRGGAIANLVGSYLNDSTHAQEKNIYTYTFATAQVRRSALCLENHNNILENHNNIFNIINRRDTLTPNAPPTWHRYGQNLYFSSPVTYHEAGDRGVYRRHRDYPQTTYDPHNIRYTYLRWMQNNDSTGFDTPPPTRPENLTSEQHLELKGISPRHLQFNSPVDIRVYNEYGILVAEIIDNIAMNIEKNDTIAFVMDESKHIILPEGGNHTIRLVATDYGTLTYTVEFWETSTGNNIIAKIFENVALYPGKEMMSETINGFDDRLFIVEDGEIIGEITEDGSETLFALGISITGEAIRTLQVGQNLQLEAIITPINATNQDVIWSSSNPTIATITENGEVRVIATGTAIITVTSVDGNHTASVIITVTGDLIIRDPDTGENDGSDNNNDSDTNGDNETNDDNDTNIDNGDSGENNESDSDDEVDKDTDDEVSEEIKSGNDANNNANTGNNNRPNLPQTSAAAESTTLALGFALTNIGTLAAVIKGTRKKK